jgi:hypothetical protein
VKKKIKTKKVAQVLFDFLDACERGDYGSDKAEDRGRRLAVHEIAKELDLPTDKDDLEHLYWKLLRDE